MTLDLATMHVTREMRAVVFHRDRLARARARLEQRLIHLAELRAGDLAPVETTVPEHGMPTHVKAEE